MDTVLTKKRERLLVCEICPMGAVSCLYFWVQFSHLRMHYQEAVLNPIYLERRLCSPSFLYIVLCIETENRAPTQQSTPDKKKKT
jgi:hypothetical protein